MNEMETAKGAMNSKSYLSSLGSNGNWVLIGLLT